MFPVHESEELMGNHSKFSFSTTIMVYKFPSYSSTFPSSLICLKGWKVPPSLDTLRLVFLCNHTYWFSPEYFQFCYMLLRWQDKNFRQYSKYYYIRDFYICILMLFPFFYMSFLIIPNIWFAFSFSDCYWAVNWHFHITINHNSKI